MKRLAFYGDDIIEVDLPEGTRVLKAPEPVSGIADYPARVQSALRSPLGVKPLRELVSGSSRVTLAFDDPVLPLPPLRDDPRGRAIEVILEELYSAGVERDRISLICATGLHRKWSNHELKSILGRAVWSGLGPTRISNHDAEDPNGIVEMGTTREGFPVRVNSAVASSDLLIYVNINWTSMNGGWKSVLVGLGDYRSISCHHNVGVLVGGGSVMDPASEFHRIVRDMGCIVDDNARVFTVETVLNNRVWGPGLGGFLSLEGMSKRLPLKLLGRMPQVAKSAAGLLMHGAYLPSDVHAGAIDEVHEATLESLSAQQVEVEGQSDALLLGVPNLSPYSAFSRINPLLVANTALGYVFSMYRGMPLVRRGGVMILLQPFLPGFKKKHHPSYIEFFDRVLPLARDPYQMESEFEQDFAERTEYIRSYRFGYAYHGVHPFYVWYWCAPALEHLERVIVVGAAEPAVPERMGFSCTPSLEQALDEASEILGPGFSLTHLQIPPVFTTVVD